MTKHPTNEELRRLKSLHRLTIVRIAHLLNSDQWGGPAHVTIASWLSASKNTQMPANSLDLLIIRLKESGYTERK